MSHVSFQQMTPAACERLARDLAVYTIGETRSQPLAQLFQQFMTSSKNRLVSMNNLLMNL